MPRKPQPWYWSERGEWYVTLQGQRHRLGPDADEANRQFHALLAQPQPRLSADTVAVVFQQFLEFVKRRKAPRTYEWYRDFIQRFLDETHTGLLKAQDLRSGDVTAWLDSQATWGDSTRHGAATAITRAFRWAVQQGLLPANPLAHVARPPIATRDQVVSDEHYRYMLAHSGPCFARLLTVAWETGARPQEIRSVEARHVDLGRGTWTFDLKSSKGRRTKRVVYLSQIAREATEAALRSDGPIFRNAEGQPWTVTATVHRFRTFARHLGVQYCLYDFRHTFATRMLLAGMDSVTLAALLGHRDTLMISRVYAHLHHDPARLRAKLECASAAALDPSSAAPPS